MIAELFAHFGARFESFTKTHEQVVVRKHVARAFEILKRLEQRFEITSLVNELRILLIEHLFQRQHLVNHHAEHRGNRAFTRKVLGFRDADLATQQIDQVFSVALVQYGEVFGDARVIGKLAQHRVAEGVERAARNALATRIGKRSSAREHARRGATRKRQQQDRLRLHADLDETRHAIDERARLSCSGAGNDQQRTIRRRNSLKLCLV